MSYFISPPEETDWKIDCARFADNLRTKWQKAYLSIVETPESHHLLEWTLRIEDRELEGSLDRTRQVIHLDGDVWDCAEFTRWFRSQVPSEHKLIFYDEGYSADVELQDKTSEAQIVGSFLLKSECDMPY